MSGVDSQEFDDDDIEHDPADLSHPDDTEDVAMQKLARRMSRTMEVSADELMPSLCSLVVAEQLRQEAREDEPQAPPRS